MFINNTRTKQLKVKTGWHFVQNEMCSMYVEKSDEKKNEAQMQSTIHRFQQFDKCRVVT